MFRDYTAFLWLLKLGALANLYFLVDTTTRASGNASAHLLLPAQLFFAVSAYRCLFPVRYEHNIVFHDSAWSSVFATRLLATLSEVAYVSLAARVLDLLNVDRAGWVGALGALMVALVVTCQLLVWVALLTERFEFYFYEELGWALIYAANTIASAYLYLSVENLGAREVLLQLNLVFGAVYLPWQLLHLRALRANTRESGKRSAAGSSSLLQLLAEGLRRSVRVKNRRTDAQSWGGAIGLTWMTGYWATLLPLWVYYIVKVLAPG